MIDQAKRMAGQIAAFLKNLFFEERLCPVCASEGAGLCQVCLSEMADWGSFQHEGMTGIAMVHYHGSARQLIYLFKQKNSWQAQRGLALIMDRWLDEYGSSAELNPDHWDYIVPVPSAPKRRRKRGFDPATVLGGHLSARSGIPLLEALKNIGQKEHKTMDRRDRRTAARDSFQLRENRRRDLRQKRILIFDDIMTTGNTLTAAAQLMEQAEAAQIGFLVLERATR